MGHNLRFIRGSEWLILGGYWISSIQGTIRQTKSDQIIRRSTHHALLTEKRITDTVSDLDLTEHLGGHAGSFTVHTSSNCEYICKSAKNRQRVKGKTYAGTLSKSQYGSKLQTVKIMKHYWDWQWQCNYWISNYNNCWKKYSYSHPLRRFSNI